jgi:DNA-binding response OmpR family regulator
MSGEKILVVEDDPSMSALITAHLRILDYEVVTAADGPEALRIAGNGPLDVILLDITLPVLDGLEVCRRLRSQGTTPIILVTAADSPETKITALDNGGDDYLTKPFHSGELTARIRAVLRRSNKTTVPDTIDVGDLRIDTVKRLVTRAGEPIHLTKLEFGLLRELAGKPDRVLTYEHLLNEVWGANYDDIRPVHVHICNLRRKIERAPFGPRYILPVPGVGYRFRMPV